MRTPNRGGLSIQPTQQFIPRIKQVNRDAAYNLGFAIKRLINGMPQETESRRSTACARRTSYTHPRLKEKIPVVISRSDHRVIFARLAAADGPHSTLADAAKISANLARWVYFDATLTSV